MNFLKKIANLRSASLSPVGKIDENRKCLMFLKSWQDETMCTRYSFVAYSFFYYKLAYF